MTTNIFKKQFPIFKSNPKLVYLDSGASTQTAKPVLDAMNEYYTKYRANVHRGMYQASMQATEKYEAARTSLAKFLNAQPEEIIITPGTTFGLNALARSLAPRLSHRDNIVLTRLEHHANLVPWQEMARHYGFEIRFIELAKPHPRPPLCEGEGNDAPPPLQRRGQGEVSSYTLDIASAKKLIDANTKIVSFAHASNVLGTINPARKIIKIARSKAPRAYTIIDAAQSAAHLPLDVKKLDCDFLVLSGHKMYGPTGVGVLYGKKHILEEHLEPFMYGGDMVADVTYERADWNEVPYKFEAGTPPIAEAIGLGAAAEFIMKIGWKNIIKHEQELTKYAIRKLIGDVETLRATSLHGVQIIGPKTTDNRIGVISFTMPNAHPHDIAEVVSRSGVAIRVGHHCAMPLHKHLKLVGTARASIGIYNTKQDIDKLVEAIKQVNKIFK